MTLREKLRLVEGGLVDPQLLTLKESTERAAQLAADNRRRLTVLRLVVEDAIASLSKSVKAPPTDAQASRLISSRKRVRRPEDLTRLE